MTEMAVWSGDTVKQDKDGFLYFIGRKDEMIKTSGYRVSPTEVEEVVYASGLVGDAVAIGVPHPRLGQAIVVVASPPAGSPLRRRQVAGTASEELPTDCSNSAAHACRISWCRPASNGCAELPRNPNGKFDRPLLAQAVRTTS